VEGVGEEGAAADEGDDSEGDAGREEQAGGRLGGDADRVGDGAEDVLRGGVGAALDLKEAGVDALGARLHWHIARSGSSERPTDPSPA
jgi:hypothetical protein